MMERVKNRTHTAITTLKIWTVVLTTGLFCLTLIHMTPWNDKTTSTLFVSQPFSTGGMPIPGFEHETLRRKVETDVREFWYYLSAQLKQLKSGIDEDARSRVDSILTDSADYYRTALADLLSLSEIDGARKWRQKEAEYLSNVVQTRIHSLQNRRDCSGAVVYVCSMDYPDCGFGCQVHHVVNCFISAYFLRRTITIHPNHSAFVWEDYFLPLVGNSSCLQAQVDITMQEETYITAVPADLSRALRRLHGKPMSWWVGQFVKFLTRPQPWFNDHLNKTWQEIGFRKPIVGVHIRRTDKVNTEADFHDVDEYMTHVNDYYDLLEMTQQVNKRRIYLSSDDPSVFQEVQIKYPDYEVICDCSYPSVGIKSERFSHDSMRAIIVDIHFLSHSDYVVCTMSSNVCRMTFELMQTIQPDASNKLKSLDVDYSFVGRDDPHQVALVSHIARSPDEIDLLPGDNINFPTDHVTWFHMDGNHWDGFSRGTNKRTGYTGLYPSYKAVDYLPVLVDRQV